MTKTYIDELAEEIAKLNEENKRLKEENRALAKGSFLMVIESINKIKRLKELLKECRDYLEDDSPLSMASMINEIDKEIKDE